MDVSGTILGFKREVCLTYKTQTVGGLWVLSGTGVPLPEPLVNWVGSADDMLLLVLL
jgi:hypothetical protein